MGFNFPGGDVAACTGIWILLAVGGIWLGITGSHFPWYFAAAIVTGLAGLGMWFQVQSAGYVFGSINGLLTIIGILGLVFGGFSLRIAIRVVGTMYATWISFQWAANVED